MTQGQQDSAHTQGQSHAPSVQGQDEQAAKLARRGKRFRRAKQAVLAVTMFFVLVCAGMVVTAAINDVAIAREKATATAEVTDVGTLRTSVLFRDEFGNYHQPNEGLKYPIGLEQGQRVRVEYQASNPANVKVEGRSWTLAFLPALSSIAVVLVLAGLLWSLVLWLERRGK